MLSVYTDLIKWRTALSSRDFLQENFIRFSVYFIIYFVPASAGYSHFWNEITRDTVRQVQLCFALGKLSVSEYYLQTYSIAIADVFEKTSDM
jgi:hypothetical protein